MNIWLFAAIHAVTSVIMTFALIVGMLTLYTTTGMNFVWCFVIGLGAAVPIAWIITKRMVKG